MAKQIRLEVYRDPDSRFRWRAVAGNNRIVGASEESFFAKWYCKRKARKQFPAGEIVDLT